MNVRLTLLPLALLALSACSNPLADMTGLIEQSTEAIKCNICAVQHSTDVIRENRRVVDESTVIVTENHRVLETASE